jgi:MFS family permease
MLPEAARAAGLQLERANGMHEAIWGVAYLVGPGVGGLLIAVVGATNAFWATAALFAVSAGLMFVVRIPGAGRPEMHGRLREFWPATREGLVFLWRDPVLRSVAVMTALVVGFWLPIEGVVLPVYFEARQQPGHLGAVLMAISAGAVIGALAYAAVGARFPRRRALNGSLLGAALAVLGMAFLPPLPALLAFGFVSGIAYGPINPIGNVALQERTPDRLRGRVLGLSTSIAYAAGPAGYLLVGPLIDNVGVRGTFLLLAGGLVVVAVASLAVRGFKGLDDVPDRESSRLGP